jgi:hypothetical protein
MTSVNEIMKLAGRWRTANYAEREEARADLQAAVETVAAELAKKDAEITELKQMLMRWLNDALSAEDVKKLEKQTLEVLK